jgi:hypothetical protein
MSKNSKRIISVLISFSFSLMVFAIDRYIVVAINEHYFPEIYNENWIWLPIALSIFAVYFFIYAFKGKFKLWDISNK